MNNLNNRKRGLPKGYCSKDYIHVFSDQGKPVFFDQNMGNLIMRPIFDVPDTYDAMSCYPFFCSTNWSGLCSDINSLSGDLVSVSLVTDPFGDFRIAELRKIFANRLFLFKNHFIVDFKKNWKASIGKHHNRNIRKALSEVDVEFCTNPSNFLDDWCQLYRNLIYRHNIKGITAFSDHSFRKLLHVPGIEAFRATLNGKTIGMTLWMVQSDIGYYHLGAYNNMGYKKRASFAIFDVALNHYAEKGLNFLGLGAGAGIQGNSSDGLSRFKDGWANAKRPVYFCGKIFNKEKYFQLTEIHGATGSSYFPAYRTGEFC